MKVSLILSMALAVSGLMSQAHSQDVEAKLAKHLMDKIKELGNVARPVNRTSEAVNVELSMSVLRVESVRRGEAELDCYIHKRWKDHRLAWSKLSRLYEGISSLAVPTDSMWLPDIRPYNIFGIQHDKEGPIRAVISKDGSISYIFPARIRFNYHAHSNGSLTCRVKFGSWVYNGNQLDIKLAESISVEMFADNNWKVSGASAVRMSEKYDCCEELFISVMYELILEPHKPQKWR